LSAERCKHMGAPRSRRRKLCLLSTTVRPDPWPSRGRQLNLIFGSFRGCKSRFYADFRLFSENCCGGTPAGMEVFPEMGGMPAILVACTLRSRPCAGTPPACHQSLPVAPAAPPPTHAAHPSFTGSVTIIGPATGRRKGVFGGTLALRLLPAGAKEAGRVSPPAGRAPTLHGARRTRETPFNGNSWADDPLPQHLAGRKIIARYATAIPYRRPTKSASGQAAPLLFSKASTAPADTGSRHLHSSIIWLATD